jgi:hypothetical protein
MRLLTLSMLLVVTGCAPVLHLTTPTPPEGNLGTVRTMSVSVTGNVGNTVEQSVATGILMGEIPVPVPMGEVVKQRFEQKLQALGYAVCPAAPCGDGAMTIEMLESSANSQVHSSGVQVTVRLKARIVVTQNDKQVPYDWSFWDSRSGSVDSTPQLVINCADHLTARFESTLQPGRVSSSITLVDGDELTPGVNMLFSSNWEGAIAHFTQLTQQQPNNDGAWYDLGVAWEAYGDWGQALSAYQRAAALKRSDLYLEAVAQARSRAPAQPQPQQQAPVQPIPMQ